ncbi:MAG: FkbM family methyltransferase [Lachnospiraceae bacterium]|nr:FkbM family methyltransferase [Lachnospiraceae bacterium]
MSKVKDLLIRIREAVKTGTMQADAALIDKITHIVKAELDNNKFSFSKEQCRDLFITINQLREDFSNSMQDTAAALLYFDALILCVNTISTAIYALISKEYWEYKHQTELGDPEIRDVIEHIGKTNQIQVFNYDFVEEYKTLPVEVFSDESCGMFYVPYRNRRMYFPKGWQEADVVYYYKWVMMEQDQRSPHCYDHEDYGVLQGDVVVDAGVAEGNFALNVIDKVKKIYLIEADERWIEALEKTFASDMDKVEIIRGFLSGETSGDNVCLDQLFAEQPVNYVKMDIEGYEKQALSGAKKVIGQAENIRCAVCTYHFYEDEELIRKQLQDYGFETEVSKGYMFPDITMEELIDARLRRGLIFGRK